MSDDVNSEPDDCAASSSSHPPPSPSTINHRNSISNQDKNSPAVLSKRRKSDSRPIHLQQQNKCINEKRRREQENVYIEELAELIATHLHDMSSLAVKPDKCAILQETVKQIRIIKQQQEILSETGEEGTDDKEDLQASEVSSSKPTLIANDVLGPLLLEALEGFLFVVNTDGLIEFVSENVTSFLKHKHVELVGKSIYNIIHIGDHSRFSTNLLPMAALGNGFGWQENNVSAASTTSPVSASSPQKSRQFNARFLKASRSDEASTSTLPYESMQVCAIPIRGMSGGHSKSDSSSSSAEECSLVCVARRIPHTDNSPNSITVEQFTTRLDFQGKILTIDTSGVSSTYSQHLNKDFVGQSLLELSHPDDHHGVNKHLKDTLTLGSNQTSPIYRLRLTTDRYVHVRTKSKRFNCQMSQEEFIMSTHSIIKDSDSSSGAAGMVEVSSSFSYPLSSPSTTTPGDLNSLNECLSLSDVPFPSSSWETDPHSTQNSAAPEPLQEDGESTIEEQKLRDLLGTVDVAQSDSQDRDHILRDLLNQEEEDVCDVKPSPAPTSSNNASRSATPLAAGPSVGEEKKGQLSTNANNMLRQLLNDQNHEHSNGTSSTSRKRGDDILIQQLLKDEASQSTGDGNNSSSSFKRKFSDLENGANNQPASQVPMVSGGGLVGTVVGSGVRPTKQLAGQNPMLASMLAQTPRSLPPTVTIPTSIVSQVPQEKLPRNLEKKLLPVPVTPHEGHGGQTYYTLQVNGQERTLNAAQLQHLEQQAQARNQHQSHPMPTFVLTEREPTSSSLSDGMTHATGHQVQQGYLNKILMESTQPRAGSQASNIPQQSNSVSSFSSSHTARGLPLQGMEQFNEEPDPLLSSILDEVWSLQEDLQNRPQPVRVSSVFVSTSEQVSGSNSSDDLFKLLDEVLETNSEQDGGMKDASEKAAILDIQKQLMSFETGGPPVASHPHLAHHHPPPVYSPNQAGQMRALYTRGPQAVIQHRPQPGQVPLHQTGPLHFQPTQPPVIALPQQRMPQNKQMVLQHRRLSAQQSQQSFQMRTQQNQPPEQLFSPTSVNADEHGPPNVNIQALQKGGPPAQAQRSFGCSSGQGMPLSPAVSISSPNVSLTPNPGQHVGPHAQRSFSSSPHPTTSRMSPSAGLQSTSPWPQSSQTPNSPASSSGAQISWIGQHGPVGQSQQQQVNSQGNILSANPMLNAQLSTYPTKPPTPRYSAPVQRHPQQPMNSYSPNQIPAPQQQQQIRLQPRYTPTGLHMEMGPQSQQMPSQSHPVSSHFAFDGLQAGNQSQAQFQYSQSRQPSMSVNSSDYVKQELRAMVSTRNHQSLTPNPIIAQSVSQDLDDITLTLGLSSSDPLIGGSPESPLFPFPSDPSVSGPLASSHNNPTLMAGTSRSNSMNDESSPLIISRPLSTPDQQKKSLLQQLLSEPS